MSDPFLGEIKIWAMPWAPKSWALCDGSILNIAQNQALYSLLGVQFGGDAKTTFALPDFRGRVAMGTNLTQQSRTIYSTGNSGGAEQVTLTPTQVPGHTHAVVADNAAGGVPGPIGNYLATVQPNASANFATYAVVSSPANLNAQLYAGSGGTVTTAGGGGAHANIQPYSVVNFAICTTNGVYPPRP
jgi:microcystin-dependent protein